MANFPVLPQRYYLTHFFELIDFLESHSRFLMDDTHLEFLNSFRNLSEDAQCIYVRMINRKGCVFPRSDFEKYQEIQDPDRALNELKKAGFVGSLSEDDHEEVIDFLTKPDLVKWLNQAGLTSKKSASKDDLRSLVLENRETVRVMDVPDLNELWRQEKSEELSYLLFLYFGRIQKSLNLYTLRDLGIRRTNEKQKFRPRYANVHEARAEYFYLKERESPPSVLCFEDWECVLATWAPYPALTTNLKNLRDEILLHLAESCRDGREELCLTILSACEGPSAREKRVRILWKLARKEEARILLEEILREPRSDEELLFAEDFVSRKFEGRRTGTLTEALRQAPELTLSDAYFRRPERGVKEHFQKQGYQAHYSENHLWNGLFGIFFWTELFESEKSSIFNPFERSPVDLVGPEFYDSHKESLEEILLKISDLSWAQAQVLKTVSRNYGKLNDIFQWHPLLLPQILEFLKVAQGKNLAQILRTMAQQYGRFHSGFPDLMISKDQELRFIEVKAEGDALRAKQFSKFKFLRDAGFPVDLLKVKWQADPEQTYVVVDVETTGGSSAFHRVTEIGAVKVKGGEVIDEFQTLLNPGRSIPAFITRLTGITNEMVSDAPRFEDVAESFLDFIGNGIFVAHNVRFDYGFILREFQRTEHSFSRPQLCTCSGMRKAFPGLPSYSLKNLTDYFQIRLERHHRALDDAKAAAELLLLMNGKRKTQTREDILDF